MKVFQKSNPKIELPNDLLILGIPAPLGSPFSRDVHHPNWIQP